MAKITQKQISGLKVAKELGLELLKVYHGTSKPAEIAEVREGLVDWFDEANKVAADWDDLSLNDRFWLLRMHLLPVVGALVLMPQKLQQSKSYAKSFLNYADEVLQLVADPTKPNDPETKALLALQEHLKWAIPNRVRFVIDYPGNDTESAPNWQTLKCAAGGDFWDYPACKPPSSFPVLPVLAAVGLVAYLAMRK